MPIRTALAATIALFCGVAVALAGTPDASAVAPTCRDQSCGPAIKAERRRLAARVKRQALTRRRSKASVADASGVPMPVGDLTSGGQTWHQVFADDFANENTPLGQSCGDQAGFPNTTPNWDAYPWPWRGQPNGGFYCPGRTTSIHEGVMDIWLHGTRIGGQATALIDAPLPVIPGYPDHNGQLYGRYAIEFYEPSAFPMFHISWLLWPDSNTWPRDGEIDFPETDSSGNIEAFMHWQGGHDGSSQDAYSTHVPIYGRWHEAVIEWLPSRCTFTLDGVVIGNSTHRAAIPDTPMHFVLQFGRSTDTPSGEDAQGHVYVDWVAIWAPAESSK
jgi:Glycosyl hydrolases family 16